jgi:hypothetical protein
MSDLPSEASDQIRWPSKWPYSNFPTLETQLF